MTPHLNRLDETVQMGATTYGFDKNKKHYHQILPLILSSDMMVKVLSGSYVSCTWTDLGLLEFSLILKL